MVIEVLRLMETQLKRCFQVDRKKKEDTKYVISYTICVSNTFHFTHPPLTQGCREYNPPSRREINREKTE
jgi:hypothetical protein